MIVANEQGLSKARPAGRRRAAAVTGARTPKKRAKAAAGKTLKIERWFSDPKVSPFDQV